MNAPLCFRLGAVLWALALATAGCIEPNAGSDTDGGTCAPACADRECGDDGCGGSCGTCPQAAPQCVQGSCQTACTPACADRECGDDGCGGSCGTCPRAAPQCVQGMCQPACTPACDGRTCGDDGCGGSCGDCSAPRICDGEAGQCVCPNPLATGADCHQADLLTAACPRLYGASAEEVVGGQAAFFGAVLPYSGALSVYGPPMDRAVELAVEEINQAGGLGGRPLAVLSCDSGSDGKAAGEAIAHLASAGARGVVGPAASGVTMQAFVERAQALGVLLLSPSATSSQLTTFDDDGLLWRTAPSDALQGTAIGRHLFEAGYEGVAIVFHTTTYGQGIRETIEAAYCDMVGCDGALALGYDPFEIEPDLDAAVAELLERQPEVVAVVSFLDDGVEVINRIAAAGFYRFVVTDALRNTDLIDRLDEESVRCHLLGTGWAEPTTEVAETFALRHVARWGEPPGLFAANAYDATYLLALAIGAAPTDAPDGPTIAAQLGRLSDGAAAAVGPVSWNQALAQLRADPSATVDVDGASGPLDFDPETGDVVGVVDMWYLDHDVMGVVSLGPVYSAGEYHDPGFEPAMAGGNCADW